jgi:hypothetical protein
MYKKRKGPVALDCATGPFEVSGWLSSSPSRIEDEPAYVERKVAGLYPRFSFSASGHVHWEDETKQVVLTQ